MSPRSGAHRRSPGSCCGPHPYGPIGVDKAPIRCPAFNGASPMTLAYGFAKARVTSRPTMRGSRHHDEIQYHLHFDLDVDGATWDVAVNVGTSDADDLLKYKLVYDFRHDLIRTLA